jgi:hypothetical protein
MQSRREQDWSEEQKLAITGIVDALFGFVDANKDGLIERAEYEAAVGSLDSKTGKMLAKFVDLAKQQVAIC